MTPEELDNIKKIAACVPFIDGSVGAGVAETHAAFSTLLDHIATLEGKAAEVERLSAMVYDTAPGEFSPDGWTWKQAFTSEKARRVEAEAAIENLHEKYAQERIFRSRQTLSDNTKMENQ